MLFGQQAIEISILDPPRGLYHGPQRGVVLVRHPEEDAEDGEAVGHGGRAGQVAVPESNRLLFFFLFLLALEL